MIKILSVSIKTIDEKSHIKHWTDHDVKIDGTTIKLDIPKPEKKSEEKKDSKSSKNKNKK